MPNIAIRADGGIQTGMGHIIRCLALANELRNQGANVIFLSRYEEGIKKIALEGFEICRIDISGNLTPCGYDYGSPEELRLDAEIVSKALKKNRIDAIIIDTYNTTAEYFLKFQSLVKAVAYIDDTNRAIFPVDVLINGNIYAEYLKYKKYSEKGLLLLGLEYNLTRREFRDLPHKVTRNKAKEFLITSGGSDPFSICSRLVQMLANCEKMDEAIFHVVAGAGFVNLDLLLRLQENDKRIRIHHNVEKIWELMQEVDVAISSAGSTLYELCACGTPALSFIMADNQVYIAENMNKLGYIKTLGWHYQVCQEILQERVSEIMFDPGYRAELSEKMQKLVDAKGPERAAFKILKYLNSI